VGFSIVYTLLRLAFPRTVVEATNEESGTHVTIPKVRSINDAVEVPADCFLVRLTEDLLFPNAGRVKTKIVETVKLHYEASSVSAESLRKVTACGMPLGTTRLDVSDVARESSP
jgi:solute carrier family 26 (sodium-independent sulfate anion transporter), member 11